MMLDLLFPGWVLVLADAVMALIVGLPTYLVIRRFASPDTVGGTVVRMLGWVVPCLIALQFRGEYGPAFRLALMRPENRPARRFADRIERSPEIRVYREKSQAPDLVWISEQGGLRAPRFNAVHVSNRGFQRLSDNEIRLRNDILSRAIQGDAVCADVLTRGGGAVDDAIWALPPDVQETWFALNFTAVLAEVRAAQPIRQPEATSVEALAEIVRAEKAKNENVSIVGASMPRTARSECLKIQRIYAAVVGRSEARPGLALALVAKIPGPGSALP